MSEDTESETRSGSIPYTMLLGWPGLMLAFVWGVAEGSFFFLIPDILLSLTALFSTKRSLQQMGLVVAGSLLAGFVLFQWSSFSYIQAREQVLRVPFVRERMFADTEKELTEMGIAAIFVGPARGIPYKVYAVQAPQYTSLGTFLAVSIPARLERLVLSWLVFLVVAAIVRKLEVHPASGVVFHAIYWTAVYYMYWTTI